jgi:hypothetical protein
MDVEQIAIEGRNKLVLMDNNFLAAGDYAHEQLDKIISHNYRVDFNQALDARLVTDDFARLLAQVKWLYNRIRFGCDTTPQINDCERAMSMINSYGYKGEYFLYTMLNDNFSECYKRLMYWYHRNHRCREEHKPNIYPYAQPYRDPSSKNTPPLLAVRHGSLGQQAPVLPNDRLRQLLSSKRIQMQNLHRAIWN